MKFLYKKIIFVLFLMTSSFSFGQKKWVKILEVKEIKYYYVYKAINKSTKDTITLLGSKLDEEFKIVKLAKDYSYKIKTRPRSLIQTSENMVFICTPAITIFEGVQISDEKKTTCFNYRV